MWEKYAVAMFVVLVRILSGATEKTTKRLIEYNRTPGRDKNMGPPEYEGRITEETFDMKHQYTTSG
jgi:hypothetical protein